MINDFLIFIDMGGHGFYIWTSYFIPLALILLFTLYLRNKLRRITVRKIENDSKV